MTCPPVLFVGLGSPHGDDQAGWLVAQALRTHNLPGVEVRIASNPWDIPSWLRGHETLFVCDACEGMGMPGDWKRWSWPDPAFTRLDRPRLQESSSHQFPLVSALKLAEILDLAPRTIAIWTIEAELVAPGDDVSLSVHRAIDQVTAAVSEEIADSLKGRTTEDRTNKSQRMHSAG